MNEFVMIFLAAIIPAVILVLYIYGKDDRPEPVGQLVKAFLLGALSAPLSLCISLPLRILGYYTENPVGLFDCFRTSFYGAALPEEIAKLFVLWLVLRRNKYYDEYFDGIVYAGCVGMGFAAIENVLYLVDQLEMWRTVSVMRAFLAVPGHFLFAMLMGYYYSIAHFKGAHRFSRNYVMALVAPMIAHCLYDVCAFMSSMPFVGVLFFVGVIAVLVVLFKYFKKHMAKLKEEDYYLFDVTPPPMPHNSAGVTPPPFSGGTAGTTPQPSSDDVTPPPLPPQEGTEEYNRRFMPGNDDDLNS
ncbi:MAG: PrsW family glutamic-type intramembrane protease [Muribaculaceae bacterium]